MRTAILASIGDLAVRGADYSIGRRPEMAAFLTKAALEFAGKRDSVLC